MLSRSQRISRKEFKPLLESRKYLNSDNFSLRIVPSSKVGVAVSVSKKVSKRAVVRNRVRRRVYAVIHKLLPLLSPSLYLLVAKPRTQDLKGEPLFKELAELFKKS